MGVVVEDLRAQVDEEKERLEAEERARAEAERALAMQEAVEPIPGQMRVDGGEEPTRDPEPDPPIEELRVDGTAQLGLFEAGGKEPTVAVLKLAAGSFRLAEGRAFRKGDRIRFEGVAVVREVAQKDQLDKQTGIVMACEQSHKAQITDLVVFPAGVDGEEA